MARNLRLFRSLLLFVLSRRAHLVTLSHPSDFKAAELDQLHRVHTPKAEPDQLYHVHIPKAAGISFGHDALRILNTTALHIVSREGCHSWADHRPQVRDAMVLFRQPRKHIYSQYGFCQEHTAYRDCVREEGEPALPDTFRGWVEAWTELKEAGWSGNFTMASGPLEGLGRDTVEGRMEAWEHPPFAAPPGAELSYSDFPTLDGGGTLWHCANLPYECYSPLSMQAHLMSCDTPMVYPESTDTDQAVRRMEDTWFVGIVEAYQSSLCLLHAKLDQALPPTCNCTDPEMWAQYPATHANHRPSSHSVDDEPPEVIEMVDRLGAEDRALYEAAWGRFVRDARGVERATGMRILCDETLPS